MAKEPKPPLMYQFGIFKNTRPGIKDHEIWTDEPDIVEYIDYKYWIRLRPNFGWNLPLLGYYSRARGFHLRRP